MKTVTIAVGISTIAVLAFMILGDSAISSRVSELEGRHEKIDENMDRISTTQEKLDGALKDSVEKIEENSEQIRKNRQQGETLSTHLEKTRNEHKDRLDEQQQLGTDLATPLGPSPLLHC